MSRNIQQEDIDFEIHFYEGVLNKKSDFLQALLALAELYTQKGLHEKGLDIDRKLAALRPDDPVILYNLACSYSLVNKVEEAFRTVKKAVRCGYDDFQFLWQDKDLENLTKDMRFRRYFSRLTGRKTSRDRKKKKDVGTR